MILHERAITKNQPIRTKVLISFWYNGLDNISTALFQIIKLGNVQVLVSSLLFMYMYVQVNCQ